MTRYKVPQVWKWEQEESNQFNHINRPFSGPIQEQELPVGEHPFQLYSMATPNGVKATIMFEELLELGITEAEYDAWLIHILKGDQFGSGFVELNPNSKIPTLLDNSGPEPVRIFESGSILVYLAERFNCFLPESGAERAEALSWLFWQVGSAPYVGGGFGHFYAYASEKMEYPINRFTLETKRQLDVLDKNLANREFVGGARYSIADIAIYPWYGGLVEGQLYEAAEFLSVHDYKHVIRWASAMAKRPAVQRGRRVNRVWGDESEQLAERHSAADFV